MMYFEIAVSLLLLWILYRFINLCRVQMATGGFSKITDRRSLKSTSSCVPTCTSKKSVTEDWSSVRRSCGLNNDTVKERKGCKSPVLASTEDDLTSVGHCRRRLLHNSLEGTRNKDKLTARYGNMKLAAELLQAFPRDRYEVEDHCLEEEGGSEDIEAVTVSTTDNLQDQILIYCKPYIVALKTGILEFDETGDQLFDFVGEAMEMMDAGNYKGALLLLPEQTFLPRYLAEKLQQKGDICTLRHTDGFVRDVREEVDKLLKDEDDENDEEEHDEPERTSPSGNAYLLVVSPGEQVLMIGDEDRHGRDKEDPRTPVPLTETRKPGARPKVNRKLYPELPAQDGSQDTRATGSSKGKRETEPGDGICDVRSKAGKESSDKDQSPTRSLQMYASPSSRHLKKDPSPDERSDETSASKASSGVSSGVHVRKDGAPDIRFKENKIAAGLDGSKLDGTPDILFEENEQICDMSRGASDFEPMETESVPDYPTPMEIETTPFQRDNLADNTASSPNVSIDDGHVRLFTSNFRGSSCAGPANRLPSPPASACLPAHLSETDRQENTNRGSSSYSSRYLPVYSPNYSPCYSPGYSSSSSSAPPKKDGTPDMRYKENKIAAGLHGYKKDGTPDRRFNAHRR